MPAWAVTRTVARWPAPLAGEGGLIERSLMDEGPRKVMASDWASGVGWNERRRRAEVRAMESEADSSSASRRESWSVGENRLRRGRAGSGARRGVRSSDGDLLTGGGGVDITWG